MTDFGNRSEGPWIDLSVSIRSELRSYVGDAAQPTLRSAATGCALWTGDQLTAHLAATFDRFTRLLEQSRSGDLTPPFGPRDLDAENARAVAAFTGDPVIELLRAGEMFCRQIDDPAEIMAHQFGPIPVGLQEAFALNELVIHHDDILVTTSRRYRPSQQIVEMLVPAWVGPLGRPEISDAEDQWLAILDLSGR